MKKTLFTVIAFILFTGCAFAQTDKGNSTLGINLQFYRATTNNNIFDQASGTMYTQDQKNTNFYIGPNFSTFLSNNLDLGVGLQYGLTKINNVGTAYYTQKQTNYNYGASIYLRKYVMYESKIGIRTGPYFTYNRNSSTVTNLSGGSGMETKTTGNSYTGGLNLDLLFYPTKKLGVALMLANLNYQHYNADSGVAGNSDGDGVNFNFINNGLGVSVFYTFGK
ncbi:hypothetical protein DYU05_03070 [Mucilaginibacter terrenus]|uniref:Outer membrane protein beta-barrel domain-containing protein n=1 Tax=Mucilaginibacter terrenus TaxID=2482727 RepID=A0A3E2NUS7_9SPHI|nr:hypothetical protein [Mucilaginibacter terrenus]RFZ84610.1 hypothetical protein DYU05_03070 [Mucilaginibacter terrenus]